MNKIRLGNKDIYYQVFYKKIKHMYLRFKDGTITITCNRNISIRRIEEFIMKHEKRVLNSLDVQEQKVSLYSKDKMLVFGTVYDLNCHYGNNHNRFEMNDETINIWFKGYEFDQKYIESIYKKLTIAETMSAYDSVYDEISKDINIDNITFKSQLMKSRFGSCIPKKRIIKLNSILARLNPEYIKIILIHELIHLAVSNHQKRFYVYINRYIPNYREIIKQLNLETRKYVI